MNEEQATPAPWEQLEQIVASGDGEWLRAFMELLPPGEAAYTIARMSEASQTRLLELMPPTDAADLMEELSDAQGAEIIETLPAERAAAILDEMASDEQADLISELDEEDAEAILDRMSPEEAQDVRRLTMYEPDTAGGIMVSEYLSYPDTLRVDQLIEDLRANREKYTYYDVQYVYVTTGEDRRLRGVVRLRDVLLARGSDLISSILTDNARSVVVTDNLDALEDFFDRYAFNATPVVDEAGVLVGVVRRSSVEEALGERADKNLLKVSGIIAGEELRTMPLVSRSARRLAFLAPNIVLFSASISVILFYEPLIRDIPALAIFMPLVAGLSGASGNQAVGVSMRELALGLVRPSEVTRVLAKEAAVGVVNGLVLGVLLGVLAMLLKSDPVLGCVVGLAFALNSVVAVSLGGVVPLLLKKINLDPAMASGPIVTTLTDLCAFLLVLNLASMWLAGAAG